MCISNKLLVMLLSGSHFENHCFNRYQHPSRAPPSRFDLALQWEVPLQKHSGVEGVEADS